ncbi:MAG: tRNA dihydrouridine synthase DusB [bacterium]|nr:tRNA dihydrouridine synthase DusB [bacterium]
MITIGSIHIESTLVLAPIAGYTDSPFRRIARRHGAGFVVTELISSEGVVRKNKKTMELLRFHEEERPFGIQLFGNSAEVMADAAVMIEELKPDFIDLNMGCPATKVCKSGMGSGSALLLDPLKVENIAKNVVHRVKVPVTAKIRLGWDDTTLNYRDNVKALEAAGVSLIAVHGRTRAQRYKGKADWNAIKEINELAAVPVVGNGDICSYEEAMDRLRFTGCPVVMIGRGAIGKPWVFSGKEPTIQEQVEHIMEHLELMIEFYGDRGIILMRKHMVKYIHDFRNASKIRGKLVISTDKGEIYEILSELY